MQSIFKQRPPRKFFCDFQDCGKSFTRAEHLQRHELNHRDSPNTCARCSAHFARPDLLERHMERHAQKDKEAGGEGLGILVTRKRCWRDENGNITTKRPASSMAAVGKALEAQRQRRGDSSEDNGSSDPRSPAYAGSSMLSQKRGEASTTLEEKEVVDNAGFRGFQYEQQLEMQDRSLQGGNFIVSPVAQQSALYLGPNPPEITATAVETLSPYHYNAPELDIHFSGGYNNCGWLYEEIEPPGDTQENIDMALNRDMSTSHISTPLGPGYMENSVLLTPNIPYLSFPTQPPQPPQPPQQQQQFIKTEFSQENLVLQPHFCFSNGPPVAISAVVSGSYTDDTIPPALKHRRSAQAAENCHPHQQRHVRTQSTQYFPNPSNNSGSHCIQTIRISESPPPSRHPSAPATINEETRERVLEFIIRKTTSPTTGESPFSWENPLLSLPSLQTYLDLFFTRFQSSHPSHSPLDRQSFDPNSVDILLLLSMLMLGGTYIKEEAHYMTILVYNLLKHTLTSSGHLHATPHELYWAQHTVWFLKMFREAKAGLNQSDLEQRFRGMLINV